MANNEIIPGWYPDPAGDATKIRYWDGNAWTDNVQDLKTPAQAKGLDVLSGLAKPQPPQAPKYEQPQMPGEFEPQSGAEFTNVSITPPPIYAQGQYNTYDSVGKKPRDPKRDKFAITSMILGIVGFIMCCAASNIVMIVAFPILAIAAIIFALLGLKSTKKGMAIAGLVIGIVVVLLFAFMAFSLIWAMTALNLSLEELQNLSQEELYSRIMEAMGYGNY